MHVRQHPSPFPRRPPPARKRKVRKRALRPIAVNLTNCKYDLLRIVQKKLGWKEVGDEDDWRGRGPHPCSPHTRAASHTHAYRPRFQTWPRSRPLRSHDARPHAPHLGGDRCGHLRNLRDRPLHLRLGVRLYSSHSSTLQHT